MATFPVRTLTKLDTVVKLADPDASCIPAGTCDIITGRDTSPAMTAVDATEAGLGDRMPDKSDPSMIRGLWICPIPLCNCLTVGNGTIRDVCDSLPKSIVPNACDPLLNNIISNSDRSPMSDARATSAAGFLR